MFTNFNSEVKSFIIVMIFGFIAGLQLLDLSRICKMRGLGDVFRNNVNVVRDECPINHYVYTVNDEVNDTFWFF